MRAIGCKLFGHALFVVDSVADVEIEAMVEYFRELIEGD